MEHPMDGDTGLEWSSHVPVFETPETRVKFSDSLKPGRREEVDGMHQQFSFGEIHSHTTQHHFDGSPRLRKRLTVSELETDEEVVERIRNFLQDEPSDDEDDATQPPRWASRSAASPEDGIAPRLSSFQKRTESLLEQNPVRGFG
jgi:hypothetical protein